VVEALAQSCNSYFEQIALETSEDAALTSPATIARAYCELARRAGEPGVDEVLRGLAASAVRGTARAVGPGALAKTGTAPCTHARRAPGDGFAIVLYPASRPEFALLVRRHGAPGSEAARQAGEIVRLYRGPP
jgi:cell division protein FtsI/penicillin-binding protein 2